MNSIFEYLDYRVYLRDYYQKKKEENSFFSYRYMGRKVGIDSGYLVKIFQEKYHVSAPKIQSVIDFCQFDEKEAEYFETLIAFNKSKSEAQTKTYFEKLLSLRTVGVITLDNEKYEYYTCWYHSAVRAMISLSEFEGDYSRLANSLSPKISVKEAKESVKLLEKLELIEEQGGIYTATENHITSGSEYRPLAVRAYQRETMDLAKESLSRHHPTIRDISTLTLGIDQAAMEDIRDIIKECRVAIQKRVQEVDAADRVYQANFQFFPMGKDEGFEEKGHK